MSGLRAAVRRIDRNVTWRKVAILVLAETVALTCFWAGYPWAWVGVALTVPVVLLAWDMWAAIVEDQEQRSIDRWQAELDAEYEDEPCCGRCGSSMCWIDCEQGCDENGMVECGDSIGCCDGDHPCAFCQGSAGWWVCVSSPEWCDTNPKPGREHVERSTVSILDYPETTR